jgi:hypothetical protein
MKKIVAFVIIITLLHRYIDAQQKPTTKRGQVIIQTPERDTSWIGIIAGPNFNYLDYYDKTTTIGGRNTSFHGGVFYRKNISNSFAFQPAFLLSVRGGKIHDVDSTIDIRLVCLELPINCLYVHKGFMAGGGLNFSYGINGTLKSRTRDRNAYAQNESFERTLKRFEIGGNFMVGYILKKRIFISGNFSPGFTNIYKGDGSAPRNVRARTRTLGISLGYMFGVSKE